MVTVEKRLHPDNDPTVGHVRLRDPKTGEVYGELFDVREGWDYDKREGDRMRYRGTYPTHDTAREAAELDYAGERELPGYTVRDDTAKTDQMPKHDHSMSSEWYGGRNG